MEEKVLALLQEKEEPMKAGEIAETLGVDKKDVDKAIKALKEEAAICSPKRCYYTAN